MPTQDILGIYKALLYHRRYNVQLQKFCLLECHMYATHIVHLIQCGVFAC